MSGPLGSIACNSVMHAPARKERTFSISVPGCELFAVEVGDGAPLVMLHGGPGASHDYLRPQLDRLSEAHRRLVYYDQRGSGRSLLSTGAPWGTVGDHVDDLEAIRQALDIANLDLCGYSWGGLLALHYAVAYPQHTGRLLLVSTAPAHSAWRPEVKTRMTQVAERSEVALWKATLDLTDRRNRFAVAVAGYFLEPAQALQLTPFLVRGSAEQAVWNSLGSYDLLPALEAIQVPALLLHGVQDPIPIESARQTAAALGAPLVEIAHCAHVPYVEQPAVLFDAAIPFLRRATWAL